jgi:hypothetical protein
VSDSPAMYTDSEGVADVMAYIANHTQVWPCLDHGASY